MRKIFLAAVLLITISTLSCGASNSTHVTFRVNNGQADLVLAIVWRLNGEYSREIVTLTNSRGEWIAELPEGTKVMLMDQRGLGINLSFYIEKGNIEIVIDTETGLATIEGGSLNEQVNRYWQAVVPAEREFFNNTRRQMSGERLGQDRLNELMNNVSQAKIDFMSANSDSPIAIDIYSELSISDNWPLDTAERYFNGLSPRLRQSEEGQRIAARIEGQKALAPGAQAPLFTKTDKDGRKVSLADYRGKYVLIDFWGTWCGPCRFSHPHLVEQYELYSPLGLEFINVAWERVPDWRDNWLAAIEEDGLVWTNIADNEFPEEGSLVDIYQIRMFPTKYLIDPEGRVVGNSHHMDMDAKLAEIFGK